MPICYDIEIDIIRQREGEEPVDTVLPRQIRTPKPLTPEQIESEVTNFWNLFASLLGDTAPDRAGEYRRGEGFRILSVYQC